jgi:catechol 2,3-dioxygenase-like lactoylglutathione lyase family enzyme
MSEFQGFDHVDCRVSSLALVEAFYDALMPELGLPRKRYCYVDLNGDWHDVSAGDRYNTIEFCERSRPGRANFFMGFIEQTGHDQGTTRIAFRVERARLIELEALLPKIGARNIERSEDMAQYPAIFFEDPSGTKLEIVAREPSEKAD